MDKKGNLKLTMFALVDLCLIKQNDLVKLTAIKESFWRREIGL